MAFSFIGSAQAHSASTTTLNCTSTLDLQVGDLLVGFLSREGPVFTPEIGKSGAQTTHALALEAAINVSDFIVGFMGFRVVTAAESGVTFAADFNEASSYVHVFVLQFRPTSGATVTKDDYSSGTGTSTAANSGGFDVTGTDSLAVGMCAAYQAGTPGSEQINGTAADGAIDNTSTAASGMWYRILSSGFTGGTATATVPNDLWIAAGMSFSAVATGPSGSPGSVYITVTM